MAGVNGFGQAALRNGVYEFSRSDSTQSGIILHHSARTLIVKDDAAFFHIFEGDYHTILYSGIQGRYSLTLERRSDGLHTARNEYIEPDFDTDELNPYLPIELNITTGNGGTIEVEIVKGYAVGVHGSGNYFTRAVAAPHEKQTLAFVRELTDGNEGSLSDMYSYKIGITIGDVTWARRNVGEPGKFVDEPKDRGGLYTFDEAQTACPPGWRLPTREEFEALAGIALDWTTERGVYGHWFGIDIVVDTIFLPAGGYRKNDGVEYQHNVSGQYWSSTPHDESTGTSLYFDSDGVHPPRHTAKDYPLSVRCVAVNRK